MQFARGGTNLLVILVRRRHFIGHLREEAPFYSVNLGGGVFILMSKTILEVGWGFILWSMLYLES